MRPYKVLSAPVRFCHEQKRSTFTALLQGVECRQQALAVVADIRREVPGASHYCWAYLLGPADQPLAQAYSDDGEPGGTAGKPILNVLQQRGVGDCLTVVVRVFGGVKLGAGGLVRAYSAAVSGALDVASFDQVTPRVRVSIAADFAAEEPLRHLLASHNITPDAVDYREGVILEVSVPEAELATLTQAVQAITAGNVIWREGRDVP